jgi:Na+/proline symporter
MRALLDLVEGLDNRWVLAALLLALDLWAIGLIARARPSRREGLLWSTIVLLCPIVGCLFWYVMGPKPDLSRGRSGTAAPDA